MYFKLYCCMINYVVKKRLSKLSQQNTIELFIAQEITILRQYDWGRDLYDPSLFDKMKYDLKGHVRPPFAKILLAHSFLD